MISPEPGSASSKWRRAERARRHHPARKPWRGRLRRIGGLQDVNRRACVRRVR
jgi:hypothetical protein